MSILHHGTERRGVVMRRLPPGGAARRRRPSLPPSAAATVSRTLASALVLAAGLFYALVTVRGLGGLLDPPPGMVSTANGAGTAVQSEQAGPAHGDANLNLLLRPLALTGAALAALLLLWSGARGLNFRRDQRRWRGRQATALVGCASGMLAFGLGLAAAGMSAAAYADATWNGLQPVLPTGVLALSVAAIALLLPVPGRPGTAARNGKRPAGD